MEMDYVSTLWAGMEALIPVDVIAMISLLL
jgi:hypothetical protein